MNPDDYAETLLAQLFSQARLQFGNAIKSHWFYSSEFCPGCGQPLDISEAEESRVLSLNAFIYRPRGVLIGYLLCNRCATQIFEASRKHPGKQIPLHTTIEENLVAAYKQHMASLDA